MTLRTLMLGLGVLLLVAAADELSAQTHQRARRSTFGQDVPPFLRAAPVPRTVTIAGRPRTVPSFTTGVNPRTAYPALFATPPDGLLGKYARLMGYDEFLTYPYLENFADTPNGLPVLQGLRGPTARFDYRQAAPHLAFFCRLEINEAANYAIPLKFRLGGVRHWQDELRRD